LADETEEPTSETFDLVPPNPDELIAAWKLTAWNKRVLRDWEWLCQNTPEDANNCYRWLAADAMRQKPMRCYPLKGSKYAG
jgi:hypothetical protein